MDLVVNRFSIWLIELDPTRGSEISKTRPCLIISPNESNNYLNTVIIVPLTSTIKNYPTRINIDFQSKKGQIALDQIRSVDKSRLLKEIGNLNTLLSEKVCSILNEYFEY